MAYKTYKLKNGAMCRGELDTEDCARYDITITKRTKEGQQIVGVNREYMCDNDQGTSVKTVDHYAKKAMKELWSVLKGEA